MIERATSAAGGSVLPPSTAAAVRLAERGKPELLCRICLTLADCCTKQEKEVREMREEQAALSTRLRAEAQRTRDALSAAAAAASEADDDFLLPAAMTTLAIDQN